MILVILGESISLEFHFFEDPHPKERFKKKWTKPPHFPHFLSACQLGKRSVALFAISTFHFGNLHCKLQAPLRHWQRRESFGIAGALSREICSKPVVNSMECVSSPRDWRTLNEGLNHRRMGPTLPEADLTGGLFPYGFEHLSKPPQTLPQWKTSYHEVGSHLYVDPLVLDPQRAGVAPAHDIVQVKLRERHPAHILHRRSTDPSWKPLHNPLYVGLSKQPRRIGQGASSPVSKAETWHKHPCRLWLASRCWRELSFTTDMSAAHGNMQRLNLLQQNLSHMCLLNLLLPQCPKLLWPCMVHKASSIVCKTIVKKLPNLQCCSSTLQSAMSSNFVDLDLVGTKCIQWGCQPCPQVAIRSVHCKLELTSA